MNNIQAYDYSNIWASDCVCCKSTPDNFTAVHINYEIAINHICDKCLIRISLKNKKEYPGKPRCSFCRKPSKVVKFLRYIYCRDCMMDLHLCLADHLEVKYA